MKRALITIVAAIALSGSLTACVVYEPYPYGAPPPGPSAFDRSWNAALGAMSDQGVQVNVQDRATGRIEGKRGAITMRSNVVTQADGKVRVEFNASGSLSEDPSLPDRVSRAYDARMGR
jgi:hypothetical protein